MSTIGEFLVEKGQNMVRWVNSELGTAYSDTLFASPARNCFIASTLKEEAEMVKNQDFSQLLSKMTELNMDQDLIDLAHKIWRKESMHTKFWAYMNLFATVISESEADNE